MLSPDCANQMDLELYIFQTPTHRSSEPTFPIEMFLWRCGISEHSTHSPERIKNPFNCKVKYSIEIFFKNVCLKYLFFQLITGKTTNNQGRGKGTKRKMNTVENARAKKLKK